MIRPPHEISTVFFDLDGTLLDNGDHGQILRDACRDIAAERPEIDADRLAAANDAAWAEYWPGNGAAWMTGALSTADLTVEVWTRALVEAGVRNPSRELVLRSSELLTGHERRLEHLFDDAVPALTTLRERGYRLACVTNGASAVQRAKLQRFGLSEWFSEVVISSEVGAMKPDPRIFETALAKTGADRARACFIGDNFDADVRGASAAGLVAIWLDRDGDVPDRAGADIVAHTLEGVTDRLPPVAGTRPGATD